MAKFKLNDKHIALVNAIAGGTTAQVAYLQHMAVNPKCSLQSAAVTVSRLLKRPDMKELLQRTRRAREDAITGQITRTLAAEFKGIVLTADEMDSFHSAVIQGFVEIEEVIPVMNITEDVDDNGKVTKRRKQTNFMRVKRPPNVREKQISVDALYKRFGHYAPNKFYGAFKNMDNDDPGENVERYVMLSNGEKLLMPSEPQPKTLSTPIKK